MPRMIFANLPVTDLPRARAFYEALGFTNEPMFSDETTACMVWSEAIYVMLLTHERWSTFTTRPIPSPDSSEVMLALTCDSRAEVDTLNQAAGGHGGKSDVNPAQDHGFMYGRDFVDPDGHVWGAVWMDPAVASGEAPPPQT